MRYTTSDGVCIKCLNGAIKCAIEDLRDANMPFALSDVMETETYYVQTEIFPPCGNCQSVIDKGTEWEDAIEENQQREFIKALGLSWN